MTEPAPTLLAEAALEAAFQLIAATRMAGVALVNPALEVEAVGFRRHGGHRIGVLITPWFMNLVALPEVDATEPELGWLGLSSGSRHDLQLPGGVVEALTAREETVGDYLSCSLFSPMHAFPDQGYARQVAQEVLAHLFTAPAAAPDVVAPAVDRAAAPAGLAGHLERPLSRRGFLSALLPRDNGS